MLHSVFHIFSITSMILVYPPCGALQHIFNPTPFYLSFFTLHSIFYQSSKAFKFTPRSNLKGYSPLILTFTPMKIFWCSSHNEKKSTFTRHMWLNFEQNMFLIFFDFHHGAFLPLPDKNLFFVKQKRRIRLTRTLIKTKNLRLHQASCLSIRSSPSCTCSLHTTLSLFCCHSSAINHCQLRSFFFNSPTE